MRRNFGVHPHLHIVGDEALDQLVREQAGESEGLAEIWGNLPQARDDNLDRGNVLAALFVAAVSGAIAGGLIVFWVMSAVS